MGVQIGLRNLVFAPLLTDPEDGTPTYGEVTRIIGAITANINPNSSSETLFADDGPFETATTIGEIELEMNVADLPLDIQALLFGHELTSEGLLLRKAGDVPPWVAVGFKALKSTGTYRYTWLTKGKFAIPEQNHETKGDSISFQTPTTSGSFVRRNADDVWHVSADEDFEGTAASVFESWFDAPK